MSGHFDAHPGILSTRTNEDWVTMNTYNILQLQGEWHKYPISRQDRPEKPHTPRHRIGVLPLVLNGRIQSQFDISTTIGIQ